MVDRSGLTWLCPAFLCFCLTIFAVLLPADDSLRAEESHPAANPNFQLSDSCGEYPLERRLAFFKDELGRWTIDRIASADFSGRFQTGQKKTLNFGYTDSAYWVRFTLEYLPQGRQVEQEWLLEVGYALFDEVTVFVPKDGGGFAATQSGDSHPFNTRGISYRRPVFPLLTRVADPVTVYIRIRSSGPVFFPLTLWSPAAFSQKVNSENFVFGLFYGVLLVMAVYNFFLWISVRERNYAYYVVYMAGIGFTYACMNGFAYQFLWPHSPWWANQSLLFFMGWTQCAIAIFARTFLRTRDYVPVLDKVLLVFLIQAVISMIAALCGLYAGIIQITNAAIVLESVVAFTAGILCARKGYRPALFFALAFFNYLFGGVIYTFKAFGLLPPSFFTVYAIQIGTVLEVTILAFALADRINTERRRKRRALAELALRRQTLGISSGSTAGWPWFSTK